MSKSFDDENDIKRFYRHNFVGLLIITKIWYFIMYWGIAIFCEHGVCGNLLGAVVVYLKTMFFIDQVTMGSMWYMPMILCSYLILSFVSVLVKRLPTKAFVVPVIVVYLSGMIMPFVSEMSVIANGDEVTFVLKVSNVFRSNCFTSLIDIGYITTY